MSGSMQGCNAARAGKAVDADSSSTADEQQFQILFARV
jgi:hypothetical protein